MLSLIVSLPLAAQPGHALRYVLSASAASGLREADADAASQNSQPEHGSSPPALLPRADEIVLVLPARSLSWHRIVVPKVGGARLRQALGGLLEDRLLQDPQLLHLALSPGASPGSEAWVAACDRAWLHAALHTFEAVGRTVSRVVPAYAPLDAGEAPVLHVVGEPDHAWMVRCAPDGVQTLPFDTSVYLAFDLYAADVQPLAEPAVAAYAEHALGKPVRVLHSAQALVAAARSRWNFAQFDLTSTGGTRLARRLSQTWAQWSGSAAWRPARWGLAALLLANLAGLNAWAWQERDALQAKRLEVRNLLTRSFPKVQFVVDAPVQMEREVGALRKATGAVSAADLEPLLGSVAAALPPARLPSAIDYGASELTLGGVSLPGIESGALSQALAASGYGVRQDGNAVVVSQRSAGMASGSKGPAGAVR
jgi:general secretion pathway protein L